MWAQNVEAARAADRARTRAWRAANPDKARAATRRQRYAVDATTFDAMLRRQGRACAICRTAEPNCLDHCHATGRFRGVLCRKCNAGLGQFADDPDCLRRAALYLEAGGAPRS